MNDYTLKLTVDELFFIRDSLLQCKNDRLNCDWLYTDFPKIMEYELNMFNRVIGYTESIIQCNGLTRNDIERGVL